MKVYNTLTRKKEIFRHMKGKKVKFFCCGITPQDSPHIGHAKTYVQFDVIVKYLRYRKYNVFYLQNVTDIDDKIIEKAKELKITPKEVARKYEKEYHENMKLLLVDSVDKYARATSYIKQIVKQVKTLMKKGYAYKIKDGIYYDLSKFKEYGKLSGRTSLHAEDAVSRIDESIGKRNKGDFCLWKFYKKGDPYWDTELSAGRPGWHIEDTAISETFFGPQYDMHGGARDLIFPHHEAEIAQQEAASGKKPFVKYWLHTGFLNVEGRKMAKSLGNFITIRDALKKWDNKTLRFFFISTHYRSPIDFSERNMEKAKRSLGRLNEVVRKLRDSKDKDNVKLIEKTKKEFINYMDDDFNTPKALAVLFNFTREVNKKGGSKKSLQFLKEVDKIFNVLTFEEEIPKEIIKLAEEREKARKSKYYSKSDELRKKIRKKGYIVEDLKKGYRIKKAF